MKLAGALATIMLAMTTPAALAGSVPSSVSNAANTKKAPARNILLIMADDLAPRLGTYGQPVKTPRIDQMAREGVLFERAYAQFPWCSPSRASMLTGTRPDTTKVYDLATSFRAALPDISTLPQYFREHGYFSGRVGKIFHQSVPGGIGKSGPDDPKSWDQVSDPRGRDKDAENGKLKNTTPGIAWGSALAWLDDEGDDSEQTDGKVAEAAIEMLRANKDKPFFIAVGFYRPHVPLVAPRRYFELYPPASIQIADESPASLAAVPEYTKAWTPDNFAMSAEEQRQIIRAYHASTSFMDAQVGLVLDELKRLGLDDDTIVVFTSDHGFMLGEHGQWMKTVLWDQANQVPLVIRAPGVGKAGGRSPRTVELLDLYPTLVDLAGLPPYARNEGKSLVPLLRQPKARWHRAAHSQLTGGRSVRTERWHYIEWEGGRLGAQLYDMRRDPGQKHNLAGDNSHAAIVARLKALIPAGKAEKRAKPVAYDAVRDCMAVRISDYAGAGASVPTPQQANAVSTNGMKICETLDP